MKIPSKYIVYGVGTTLLLTGLFVTGFWKTFYDRLLTETLILSKNDNSQSKTFWNSDLVPTYFSVRMFNWTNPELSLSMKEKPNFEEVGPFVFRIRQMKRNIVWHRNSTVSYANKRRWDFVPELSAASLSDRITTANVIAVTLGSKFKYSSTLEKVLVNSLLEYNEHSLYITKTAKELLFDGYHDKMLDIVKKFKRFVKKLRQLPDKFAWYYGKNITESNLFNVYTGQSDLKKLGLLYSWNYSTESRTYIGECDRVAGSNGELWPTDAARRNDILLFVSDFCSSFRLKNVGAKSVYDVRGVTFEGTNETLDNGSTNDASRCYCPNNICQLAVGVRNSSVCLGAPVFVSFPHFYAADNSYREAVVGMNPQPEKHKFHLTLQKDSGLILEIFARLQINLLIEPIDGLKLFSNIPKIFLPTIWFEEYADIPSDLVKELQFTFEKLPFWIDTSGLVLVILGTVILVSAVAFRNVACDTVPYNKIF